MELLRAVAPHLFMVSLVQNCQGTTETTCDTKYYVYCFIYFYTY